MFYQLLFKLITHIVHSYYRIHFESTNNSIFENVRISLNFTRYN
jgi:hypothetical protein